MTPEESKALAEDIGSFAVDPLKFTLYAFPWGEGELAGCPGPRKWQREILAGIGSKLQSGKTRYQAIREAVASGHGPGKTTLIAWIILWALCTCKDARVILTANTEGQLRNKSLPELSKWFQRMICKEWFVSEATSIYSADPAHAKTWRADAIPWNDSKPEAFSGLHNKGNRILVVFDEASAIPDVIWQVTEGTLSDEETEIMWLAFGNPTRSSGAFHRCFHGQRHRWNTWQIDTRTVTGTNQAQIESWIQDYGIDSDFCRVRVRGMFPNASTLQFIPSDIVAAAMRREGGYVHGDPLIMCLDIARGGDDSSVFAFRRGLDARSIPWTIIPGEKCKDSMALAATASELVERYKPDAFFVDETGIGGPILDRMHQLGINTLGVQFGSSSPEPRYANMRACIWGRMKDWLTRGGAIPNDPILEADLVGPEFHHDKHDRLLLESKEDMKRRGLSSTDRADSLAMSFAYLVQPNVSSWDDEVDRVRPKLKHDWDPWTSEDER